MYYIIGDIHGEYTKLLGLMNRIFADFDTETDEFIFLGDFIDRGSDSYHVVQYISDLTHSHTVHYSRGNHEQML
ncbi:MAG: metallophosphoesterase, partial [Spirochaetota bacterium]